MAAVAADAAASPSNLLTVSDAARIRNLEQPAIDPAGRRVALIAIDDDLTHATYHNRLLLVDVASGRIATLVNGQDVAVPRWSPDGRSLGYLATAPGGKAQLFVRDARGLTRQLTAARGDVVDFGWRPDGAALAFAAYDEPANAAAVRAHHDYFEAGDNDYTQTALTPSVHLWLVPRTRGAARRLTGGSWTLAPTDRGGIFSSQFAWEADGRHIVFVRLENAFEGDNEYSTLQQLDVASGRISKLTGHAAFEVTPQPGPSGAGLAYWYPRDGDYISENEIHLWSGGTDRNLTYALDRNAAGALWDADGRALLVCGDDGAHVRFWFVPLSGPARALDLGRLNPVCDSYSSSTFDAGIAGSVARNGALAFLAGDARSARELYYLPSLGASGPPRRLTSFNAFVERRELGAMSPFAWKGALGTGTGALTYPPGMQVGRRYPIVLLIHGGPALASVDTFVWEDWPLAQLIAAHGYIVVQPNYRGSDDSGNAFMHAIYRDTVEGPSDDVLAALAAVEALPQADPSRLAVSGWSYGGLLTSWLIAKRHDWRAAVSGAAVNDEVQSYDLSVSNVQDRYLFGTGPYAPNGIDIYRAQSPISFAGEITTPTLIWGTTGDPVVPVTMSYALFRALRERHVPVSFAVFPATTHGPGNPVQTADLTSLWLAWLDRFLKP